ncbi:hypothetical protein Q8A67_008741 [Cirrhinus molitorella]|uniref:Uncharacterized protein n=1 Tax=Cirrhinus molitorella TaxID=172907 RepID=A0AA88PXQ2_9TELE|nr:hypothetical protein Q8A67_008741 [Cirrhinus molitorella]
MSCEDSDWLLSQTFPEPVRAHCRSLLRLNEHRGHVSETAAAAGTVAPQWIHGQLRSCAPPQSRIRGKPSETENRHKKPVR